LVQNPKLEAMFDTRICPINFSLLQKKVARSKECYFLLENALDSISPQLEDKLNASCSARNEPSNEHENIDPNVQQTTNFLNAAQLEKKEVRSKNLKRAKSWIYKLSKGN
jgi:hypothetical protein